MSNFVIAQIEEETRSVVEVEDGIAQEGDVDAISVFAVLRL